jgi:hypothetical protein
MQQEDIDQALQSLSPINRQIAELRLQGNTHKEIASKLNIGHSTLLNKHNPVILEAFGVNRWEEVKEDSIEKNESPNERQKKPWFWLLVPLATVVILFSGWVLGSRFPWVIVQIPTVTVTSTSTLTPTLTLTPTSTPEIKGTVEALVIASLTAAVTPHFEITPANEISKTGAVDEDLSLWEVLTGNVAIIISLLTVAVLLVVIFIRKLKQ